MMFIVRVFSAALVTFWLICQAVLAGPPAPRVEWLGDRVERPQAPPAPSAPVPPPPQATPDRSAPAPARNLVQPVVFYTMGQKCAPCIRIETALAARAAAGRPFPLPLDRRQPPAGVDTPSLLFQGPDGRWWQVTRQVFADGSLNADATLDALLREYQRINPAPPPPPATPAADGSLPPTSPTGQAASAPRNGGETVAEMARRFAGQRGRFSFEPAAPVNTEAADKVTIRYARITGTYDLSGEDPKITLDTPQPEGSVGVAGLWVGYRVLGATWSPARELVKVATNWKTITLHASFGDADGNSNGGGNGGGR